MDTGAYLGNIDYTLVIFYLFVAFFVALVFHLQRESRREGYPLETDKNGRILNTGLFFMPPPKTFVLPHGHGEVSVPNDTRETRELALQPLYGSDGPKDPTGNPMLDGVGPASYAERADVPDLTADGQVKIRPMRTIEGFALSDKDANPIGLQVFGCDKTHGATVTDVWIDQSESMIRYYELSVSDDMEARTVLLPANFAVFKKDRGGHYMYVHAITSEQFASVPLNKDPLQVTFLEEEKIMGYYGGGLLYATPSRKEAYI